MLSAKDTPWIPNECTVLEICALTKRFAIHLWRLGCWFGIIAGMVRRMPGPRIEQVARHNSAAAKPCVSCGRLGFIPRLAWHRRGRGSYKKCAVVEAHRLLSKHRGQASSVFRILNSFFTIKNMCRSNVDIHRML